MGKYKKQLKKIRRRLYELEKAQSTPSFYFGQVSFPEYVRISEKEISRLTKER